MIRSKLFNILFRKQINQIKNESFQEGVQYEQQRCADSKSKIEEYLARDWIGRKGIFIPNEWVDPNFFTVTGVTNISRGSQLVHTYVDALTGKEGIALIGTVLPADELMVKALLKLNPFERWNMCSSKNTTVNMWSKNYPLEEITDSEVLYRKLKDVNFI